MKMEIIVYLMGQLLRITVLRRPVHLKQCQTLLKPQTLSHKKMFSMGTVILTSDLILVTLISNLGLSRLRSILANKGVYFSIRIGKNNGKH